MGRRQKQLERIWKRDNGRCGIHFMGCGQEIGLDEAEVGHIFPKAMRNAGEKDEYVSRKEKRKLREKYGVVVGPDLNVQPMHRECNEAMAAILPPKQIVQHCGCCTWLYEAREGDGEFVPVEEWMGSEVPNSLIRREFRITRRLDLEGDGKVQGSMSWSLEQIAIYGPEGVAGEQTLAAAGNVRGGGWKAGKGIGRLGITMAEMLAHNRGVRAKGKLQEEKRRRNRHRRMGGERLRRGEASGSANAARVQSSAMEERRRQKERLQYGEWLSARGKAALIAWNLCAQHPGAVGTPSTLGREALLWQALTEFYSIFADEEGGRLRAEMLKEMEQRGLERIRVKRITTEHTEERYETGLYLAEQFRKYEVLWKRAIVKREGGRGWLGDEVNLLIPEDIDREEDAVVRVGTEGRLGEAEREDVAIIIAYAFHWLVEKEENRTGKLGELGLEPSAMSYDPTKETFGTQMTRRS